MMQANFPATGGRILTRAQRQNRTLAYAGLACRTMSLIMGW